MKRANGTGSVVRLSGQRRRPYAVRVSVRDEYGHIVQKAISYHQRAAEAQAALEAYQKSLTGEGVAVMPAGVTVGAVFAAWSERAYKKMGPSSIQSHNAAWNKRVSALSDLPMNQVKVNDWQRLLDADLEAGLSQSSINNDYLLIKALYDYCMKNDIVKKDYSAFLDIPKTGPKFKRDALSPKQLFDLARMASEEVPFADTALMLCYTGFRVSEFLQLTPEDFHPDIGGYLQGGTKTKAGKNRIVPVHNAVFPFLQKWLERKGQTLICAENGEALPPPLYRKSFAQLMKYLGIPEATPHWCRHTFATQLHLAGADPLVTKWLLGHSTSSDITAHYTHATLAELRHAVDLLPDFSHSA